MGKKRVFSERKRSYSQRSIGTKTPAERFLIVCEGEKTEPNYFRSFRVPREVVDIRGLGDNTRRIVEEAVNLKSQDAFDQVWCVFDRDSFPSEDFNAAFDLARANNIEIAYSNEAFEIWYLLHFHFFNSGMSRHDYGGKLTGLLKRKYRKNDPDIYTDLYQMQETAIKNAEKLLTLYHPANPESDNPSTTVHLLVQELNRFLRD